MDTIRIHEKMLDMIIVAIGNLGIGILRDLLRRNIGDLGI